MLKKRIFCLLLALSLLSGPAALAFGGRYPDKAHLPVDYADMLPVTPFEEDGLLAALKELEGICGLHRRDQPDKAARQRVSGLYSRVLSELNELTTKVSLAGIQYDASGGGEAESALYLELSAQQTRLTDRCYQVLGVMAASPFQDILERSAGEDQARSLVGYQGMTEEDRALRMEEDQLVQTYDQIMAKGVPVLTEDRVWTWETLESAQVDGETYRAVSQALTEERDRAAGELYLQLVRLRTEEAAGYGFDNYTEYAYWALYNRDYAPEDVGPLREAAKEYLLPLQMRLLDRLDQRDLRGLDLRSRSTGEEILDAIEPFAEEFDQEMGEAFAFLREHHLYDIEYDSGKLPAVYTAALPAYGSAFIFNCPYGDYRDYSDTVHEFGHFNETFRCVQHDLWADFNIDVGEIDSQALELMFTSYARELFGEKYGQVYADAILYNLLDSVLDGCLHDEFQAAAYADPDMTVEELDRLFKQLSEEYGYYYEEGVEADSSWVETSHNFESPLYFISYATSALSALDLWFLYLDRPGRAKDLYLDLSALSLSLPYRAAIEEVGLRDIFDPDTIPELAEMLEAHLNGEKVPYDWGWNFLGSGQRDPAALRVLECAAVVFILFCVVLTVRCGRFLSRNNGWKSLSKSNRRPPEPERSGDPWDSRREKPPWEL